MSGRVILVRHGDTALNAKENAAGESAERVRGWRDIPLDADGIQHAEDVAKEIASDMCVRAVYSSDLQRALETGRRIAAECGVELVEDGDLRPWNVGDFAGQPVAQVLPEMMKLVEQDERPAPGGEPFARFAHRFLSRLFRLLVQARRSGDVLAVVTHTRNCQLAKAWEACGRKPDLTYNPDVMNDYSDEVGTGSFLEFRA